MRLLYVRCYCNGENNVARAAKKIKDMAGQYCQTRREVLRLVWPEQSLYELAYIFHAQSYPASDIWEYMLRLAQGWYRKDRWAIWSHDPKILMDNHCVMSGVVWLSIEVVELDAGLTEATLNTALDRAFPNTIKT